MRREQLSKWGGSNYPNGEGAIIQMGREVLSNEEGAIIQMGRDILSNREGGLI